jgi:single-strand DNA-binding protein
METRSIQILSSNRKNKIVMKNNSVTLRGNVGTDVTLKALSNDQKLLNFNLATNENYKDKSGAWQKNTEWHRIVVWGPQAEKLAGSIEKGNEVIVEGKIVSRTYQSKDGIEKNITEIHATDVIKTVREKASA